MNNVNKKLIDDSHLRSLIEFRRNLHENPELSFEEVNTTKNIKERLSQTNFEVLDIDSDVGLIARLNIGENKKTIGIRADIDALPIVEQSAVDFPSKNHGVMHACGHDIHTTILLGFCEKISNMIDELNVNIVVIFQPAEEIMGGAKFILGKLEEQNIKIDEIICYHTWPFLEEGKIGFRNTKMMAGGLEFSIKLSASGGHAAHPHTTADPIFLSADIINFLQSIVSRINNPVEPLVITVGKFNAGTKSNVISSEASFSGTIRSFSPGTISKVKETINSYLENICSIHNATFELDYRGYCPPVINDNSIVKRFVKANNNVETEELKEPSMGSEDFSFYLEKIPGALFRVGTRSEKLVGSELSLHNPKITFSEEAIPVGIEGLVNYIVSHS